MCPIALAGKKKMRCLVTTPTAATARALARYVGGLYPNIKVGSAARGQIHYVAGQHQVVYATAGHVYRLMMRQMKKSTPILEGFDVLILDEAHTISMDYDMLEFLIKCTWASSTYKLLIASATLDPKALKLKWKDIMPDPPVLHIKIPHYPVQVMYHGYTPEINDKDKNASLIRDMVRIVTEQNHTLQPGHILVFLPGSADIEAMCSALYEVESLANTEVYAAHASLPDEEIERAVTQQFPTDGFRAIILSTDMLETSITIPYVVLVIDSGRQKVVRAIPHKPSSTQLIQEWTSTFSTTQRKGRTGRNIPGGVYRMFTQEHEEKVMQVKLDREVDRVPLHTIIMQILGYDMDPCDIFPKAYHVRVKEDLAYLTKLGLIEQGKLTVEAQKVIQLPVELLYGVMYCRLPSHPWATLLTALLQVLSSGGSLFHAPRRTRDMTAQKYRELVAQHYEEYYDRYLGTGDLEKMLQIFKVQSQSPKSIHAWCRENSMNTKTMTHVYGLARRLNRQFKVPDTDPVAWLHQHQDILKKTFGREHLFSKSGRKWTNTDSWDDSITYYLGRGLDLPQSTDLILSLVKYHVKKGDNTLGFLSCVICI